MARICDPMKRSACILFLLVSLQIFGAEKPRRLLIVDQKPDGHPPLTHEFVAGARVLAELLKAYPEIKVTVSHADDPWTEGPQLLDQCDGLVMLLSEGSRWMQTNSTRWDALKRLAARGGGLTALHWSVGAKDAKFIDGQLNIMGATRGGEWRKYVVSQGDYKRVDPKHPILTGVPDFTAYDEHYYRLDRLPGIQPLLTVNIEGKDEMVAWSWERSDKGRSFGFVGLHFHANWQLPVYRRFVVQGVLWSLNLPIPKEGVKTDINEDVLKIDGQLPPPAAETPTRPAKK
jgi:type 1 glutamine amidotransferase